MPSAVPPNLKIAVVGGGPGGMGAAIALSALANVQVTLYEQARELREIGAGIQIGFNCWKVLELLGAADDVKGYCMIDTLYRNGLNGNVIKDSQQPSELLAKYHSHRVRRTRLQSALREQVPEGIIKLNKRLLLLENLENGKARLNFEDGTQSTVDLVVGGDGIRSVVRAFTFPGHEIQFTGTIIWRTLLPASAVSQEIRNCTQWWFGPPGHVYVTPVDDASETASADQMFEISCRNVIDPTTAKGKRFSWGVPATNERVLSHFTEFDPRIRDTLALVKEGQWKEFSAFAGPRLNRLTAWDKVVLIGDASHPLSGAFGSGAAFAMEDGYILARALEYTRSSGLPTSEALETFNAIRSPYYLRMYEYLDEQKQNVIKAKASNPNQTFEEGLKIRLAAFGGEESMKWIYRNNIEEVWESYLDFLNKRKD